MPTICVDHWDRQSECAIYSKQQEHNNWNFCSNQLFCLEHTLLHVDIFTTGRRACQDSWASEVDSWLAQKRWFTREIWKSDKNTDFLTKMGQMDLSCPQTVQNEFLQKCRETIPLVQVCFGFVLSLTVSKLYCQKSESTLEILITFWLFLAFISARWCQKNFKTTGLFKLHQNTQILKIWCESVE